jgi:hypothetical protein
MASAAAAAAAAYIVSNKFIKFQLHVSLKIVNK